MRGRGGGCLSRITSKPFREILIPVGAIHVITVPGRDDPVCFFEGDDRLLPDPGGDEGVFFCAACG